MKGAGFCLLYREFCYNEICYNKSLVYILFCKIQILVKKYIVIVNKMFLPSVVWAHPGFLSSSLVSLLPIRLDNFLCKYEKYSASRLDNTTF